VPPEKNQSHNTTRETADQCTFIDEIFYAAVCCGRIFASQFFEAILVARRERIVRRVIEDTGGEPLVIQEIRRGSFDRRHPDNSGRYCRYIRILGHPFEDRSLRPARGRPDTGSAQAP
jgi:hypothetical protein